MEKSATLNRSETQAIQKFLKFSKRTELFLLSDTIEVSHFGTSTDS